MPFPQLLNTGCSHCAITAERGWVGKLSPPTIQVQWISQLVRLLSSVRFINFEDNDAVFAYRKYLLTSYFS